VVSENAPEDYLDQLRHKGISYIVSGADSVDLAKAVELPSEHFGIRTMREEFLECPAFNVAVLERDNRQMMGPARTGPFGRLVFRQTDPEEGGGFLL